MKNLIVLNCLFFAMFATGAAAAQPVRQPAQPTRKPAQANPVVAPPGGIAPTANVSQNQRFIPHGAIQHTVCFKLKAPATLPALQILGADGNPTGTVDGSTAQTYNTLPEVVDAVKRAYYTEAAQVPYIHGFGGSVNMSHEGTSEAQPNGFGLGYDVCFSMAFASENDRDYFVGNDAFPDRTDQHHHAFRNFVGGVIVGDANATPAFAGGLLVFDYRQF